MSSNKLQKIQTTQILSELLPEFPSIKLSYGSTIHKKVFNASVILAIPSGNKFYAWFTTYKTQNVCILIELSSNLQILGATICHTSFTNKLSYGTVLFGTLFTYSKNECFSVEDIFYYKGENLENYNYSQKLELMKELFSKEIRMDAINSQFLIFGLPFMSDDFVAVLSTIQNLPYHSSTIQFRFLDGPKTNQTFNMNYIKPRAEYLEKGKPQLAFGTARIIVFKVTADIKTDIYKLFTLESGDFQYYDIACIPTFSSSVMMNKLFRNIKENGNLDALEESDDEIEFENTMEDKFVFLDRSYFMVCELHPKFRKWIPIKIADNNCVVSSMNQIPKFTK